MISVYDLFTNFRLRLEFYLEGILMNQWVGMYN